MKPNSKLIPTCFIAALVSLAIIEIGCQQKPTNTNPDSDSNTNLAGISGTVQGGGRPIAGSMVTLYVAGTGAPRQLDQDKTDDSGTFKLSPGPTQAGDVLYVVAAGGTSNASAAKNANDFIMLISVLGSQPHPKIVVNEMTTIASAWTCSQFLKSDTLSGSRLGLHIAAGNVPNFVNLETGGYGTAIQSPLNSSQTTTMANFATLSIVLSGCVTQVIPDACSRLFDAATTPNGDVPINTLMAAEFIARNPWYQPEKVFDLLDYFYPIPAGKNLRSTPFMPYLNYSPSAWVLPLKFDGGGYLGGGKTMFDSAGNAWIGDNFIVGSQGQDYLWQGNLTEFAPNGTPISPMTTGFTGGGLEGPGFGTAIDSKANIWLTTYGSMAVCIFDKHGKPLSPPDGYNFDHQLGLMQGIIVTPSGNVWGLGVQKNQVVYFPNGDTAKRQLLCEGTNADPCRGLEGPFHLAIDQQNRIWVTNALGDWVTRFDEANPNDLEKFRAGYSGSGVAVDSKGYVWVTNRFGSSSRGAAALKKTIEVSLKGGNGDSVITNTMSKQTGGFETGGSMTLFLSDGTEAPGSPFYGGSLPGPWAVAVDGDDNVWISNFAGVDGQIAHLCGTNPNAWPPGMTTGDPISPPLGYVGGGLQMQTDIAIDPAGNVWVNNNWQNIESCFGEPAEPVSTHCGGQGVTIFYGMAKPVKTPLIGPPPAR